MMALNAPLLRLIWSTVAVWFSKLPFRKVCALPEKQKRKKKKTDSYLFIGV